MKKILIFMVSCITALSVFAQYSTESIVTITVNGNRNRQVLVDGKNYSNVDKSVITNNAPATITITDLQTGQHTLQLSRTNQYNNNNRATTTFSTRPGYDLQITVNSNGTVELKEAKKKRNRNANNQYRTPMSAASFTALLQTVKKEWRPSRRNTMVSNAFENSANHFTTVQAKQLIQSVSSQTSRLLLAKSSYQTITDPANFNQLYDVLTTQAARNELQVYVGTYNNHGNGYNNNGGNNNGNNNSYRAPMSDASFNTILSDVKRQFLPGGKMSVLTNTFNNSNNYFTTAQARQLIVLVSDESNRLQLAKSAYRNITDPSNFSQLYDVLFSQASRNELAEYVRSYNSNSNGYNNNNGYNNSLKTPMSDAAYNQILSNVQNQWGLGAKMSALTDVFANTNNYFTTAQAKQLIGLVSSESNRLQLAKASYQNITDPANFTQIYDLLSSQASRNELSTYVNAYARY